MDKLNNSEDAKRLLQGLGLHISEAVVRQVVDVLSGKAHQSLYSLYASGLDKPVPVCGKGSVYKIKKLYDEGKLQPYLDYLSNLQTISESKTEQIKEADHDVPKESLTEQEPYEETPHKQKMRKMARATAEGIILPSTRDKDLWRDIPIEFKTGQYSLSIGLVEIDKDKYIKVKYYDIATGIAQPYLVEELLSHLSTSGLPRFAELVGDKGKLNNLVGKAGQYSQALLMFLKLMVDEVRGYRAKVSYHDEVKPSLTKYFILTALTDTIQQASGFPWIDDSSYKPHESIPSANLWQLKCGAYVIGIAKSERTLKTYENWHKKLRIKYAEHQLAKGLATKREELDNITQEIRQRLQEFSDIQRLPGNCKLC